MSVMTENTSKIALITGASRGLGAAVAEALAADYHIVAVGRTVGALEELDDRIRAKGGEATLAPMDITVEAAMAQLCRSIHDRWGKLDLWVHAAVHAAPMAPASSLATKDWQKSIDINVTSLGRLIPFIEPLLLASGGGQAVFFEDTHAGEKFFGAYGASKAAQIALARSWQAEAAKIGPKIHITTPAPMPTATRARFYPGEDRSTLTSPSVEAAKIVALLD
jgi:NAD(P)-dependent dehydrogenase (short-subunit alcohol dehydrogenase family)